MKKPRFREVQQFVLACKWQSQDQNPDRRDYRGPAFTLFPPLPQRPGPLAVQSEHVTSWCLNSSSANVDIDRHREQWHSAQNLVTITEMLLQYYTRAFQSRWIVVCPKCKINCSSVSSSKKKKWKSIIGKDNFQGKSVFLSQQEENPPFPVYTGSLIRQRMGLNTPISEVRCPSQTAFQQFLKTFLTTAKSLSSYLGYMSLILRRKLKANRIL